MAKIKGDWKWNDTLNIDGIPISEETEYQITYISNGVQYYHIILDVDGNNVIVTYKYLDVLSGGITHYPITENNVVREEYKNISFGSIDQDIDDAFYNWFIANATSQTEENGDDNTGAGDDNTGSGETEGGTTGGDNTEGGTTGGDNTEGGTTGGDDTEGGSTPTPSAPFPKVYVICDANCRWEGMTKEQIYTAIMQAVNEGTIGNIDTGFVSTIKTINGIGLRFFVGTQAEYARLSEAEKNGTFAIITNDTTKEGLYTALAELRADVKSCESTKANIFAPPTKATALTETGYYFICADYVTADAYGINRINFGLVYWNGEQAVIYVNSGDKKLCIFESGSMTILGGEASAQYDIYISKVGDTGVKETNTDCEVEYNLYNIAENTYSKTTARDLPYLAIFYPKYGCKVASYTLTMGGVDLTNNTNLDGTRTISKTTDGNILVIINKVTGDLVINIVAEEITTPDGGEDTVTAYNIAYSNTELVRDTLGYPTEIPRGIPYQNKFTAIDPYELIGIGITMDGEDIALLTNNSGVPVFSMDGLSFVVTIDNVTGDIALSFETRIAPTE